MDQMNIFEELHETFKFKKDTINLFEAFAGVGSQAMALKTLSKEFGFNLNTIGTSEIDKYAIQSYNAIHGETKNFGSITDIKELPPGIDIFTYSFPCQDISLAGKGKGLSRENGTRSGLLWEVERLLKCSEKPKLLLMENVKALISEKHRPDFVEWILALEKLGYSNYWKVLNAKDYGIPQNRDRVFMVSILGEYNYSFPKKFPLDLRLKDMLEDVVDEKYYLSDKMLKFFQENSIKQQAAGNGFKFDPKDGSGVAKTITTNNGSRMDDNFLLIPEKKGYSEASDGDGIQLRHKKQNGSHVKKQIAQTITTGADVGVVVKGNYHKSGHNASRIVDVKGIAPTVMENHGIVTGVYLDQLSRGIMNEAEDGLSTTLKAQPGHHGVVVYDMWNKTERKDTFGTLGTCCDRVNSPSSPGLVVENNLSIRKLTPKECWRLMGFSNEDFSKAESVCSNSQLYKQAGNSIVVDVLYYIFKQLFNKKGGNS